MSDYMVDMSNITTTYPGGVVANDEIDLQVRKGEIHGLLGENGAGKSSLMKVLYGHLEPDAGEIQIDGELVSFDSPQDAINAGVGMVHQHFKLVESESVLDNIILGCRKSNHSTERADSTFTDTLLELLTLDRGSTAEAVETLATQYGFDLNLDKQIWELDVGERQRVEILKILYRDVDVLILDEPTAVLTPEEVDELFDTLRTLADNGLAIIFITHKLKEIRAVTDRTTILRDGRVVDTVDPTSHSRSALAERMVGESVTLDIEHAGNDETDQVVLEVEDVQVRDDRGLVAVDDVSFSVRSGEIVGLAGVSGNGQRELTEAIARVREFETGDIRINGESFSTASADRYIDAGQSFIPEDRLKHGCAPDLNLWLNLAMKDLGTLSNGQAFDETAAREHARRLVEAFDVRTPSLEVPIDKLSGGNIQKAILARELDRDPDLLVASQPTRGVDVSAIEFIRSQLIDQCESGTGIVLVSEQLDEIIQMSDRILVINDGQIVYETDAETSDRRRIGRYMTDGDLEGNPA